MYVCIYVGMHVGLYVHMFICIYVCMYVYTYICVRWWGVVLHPRHISLYLIRMTKLARACICITWTVLSLHIGHTAWCIDVCE